MASSSQEGYEYHLEVVAGSFYASGLDAAERVRRRLQTVVDDRLSLDLEVLRAEKTYLRVRVDKRYFAEKEEGE